MFSMVGIGHEVGVLRQDDGWRITGHSYAHSLSPGDVATKNGEQSRIMDVHRTA